MAVNQFGQTVVGEDWIKGLFDQAANRESGAALAAGDFASAAKAQFSRGNLDVGSAIQDRQAANETRTRARAAEDRTRNLGVYRNALDAVAEAATQGPEAALSAFEVAAPGLRIAGADDSVLEQLRNGLRANPQQALATMRAAVGREELELRDGGAGDVVGVNKRTGAAQLLYDAPDRPISTPYGIILPPNSRTPVASGAQPAPAANGLPAVSGPAISGGPLWQRQENQESGGRQFGRDGRLVTSPVGAFGVSQLMPGTAADLARQMGVTPEQLRSDENLNRRAGQLYMDQQLAKYDGNEALALAAYNAGPGRVDEWVQRFGDPRTGEITTEEWVQRIPFNETQNYVQNITRGQYGDSAPVAQGDGAQMDGAQELGGGWSLQQMQTPADIRAQRTEARQDRSESREQARFNREMSGTPSASDVRADRRVITQDQQRLNTEFNALPIVRTFRQTESAFADVRALAAQNSGINDTALTYAIMKMAAGDGSVVREGEFALLGRAAGIPEGTVAAMTRAANGQNLTPEMRRQVVAAAETLYHTRRAEYNREAARFRGFAGESGANPDRVAPVSWGPEGPPEQRRQRTRAPLGFTPSAAQVEAARRYGADASAPLGSARNPVRINPADPRSSRGNLLQRQPSADGYVYFYDENGRPGRVRPGAR
jgi:hypothetical protein